LRTQAALRPPIKLKQIHLKLTDENNIKVSQVVIDRSFLGTTTSEAAATGLHHGSILLLFSEALLEEASPHLIAHHN